jgi:hypothetical protein
MGASNVRRGVKHFKNRNTDIADQPCCGRPRTAATECNRQKNRRAHQTRSKDNRESASQIGVWYNSVHEMMEILGYRKVCCCWVPRLLTCTEEHKTARKLLFHPPYSPNLAPSDYHLFGPL